MNKTSIVIQGPFDNYIWNTYKYTDHYLQYVDKVVISCYTGDNTTEIEKHISGNDRVILVKNDCPSFHCNPCNMYVHAFSTLKGLEKVDTTYSIKIRSDQFYTQIDKVVKAVEENPDKYTVCNINTLKVIRNSWKVSDHLFAAKTESLIKAMQQTMDWCHQSNVTVDKHGHLFIPELHGHGQTEHVFFLAYLKNKGFCLDEILEFPREGVLRVMKENLFIVNVNDLSPIVWSCHPNNGPVRYGEAYNYPECANSLEELGEGII